VGIIIGRGPNVSLKNVFSFVSGLCTTFEIRTLGIIVDVINVYRPYNDRYRYCERIFALNVLNKVFVIIGGDINFTWNRYEIWGPSTRVYIL